MEAIFENPAFRTYALCSSILGLKMILSAFYTGFNRQRAAGYVNPEDAKTFGATDARASAQGQEAPAVAHALRIQRNDLENIPLFFAIGLIYVLSGASAFGAAVYMWTFTVARIAHTGFYMAQVQPSRAIAFLVGALATIGMCVNIIGRVI